MSAAEPTGYNESKQLCTAATTYITTWMNNYIHHYMNEHWSCNSYIQQPHMNEHWSCNNSYIQLYMNEHWSWNNYTQQYMDTYHVTIECEDQLCIKTHEWGITADLTQDMWESVCRKSVRASSIQWHVSKNYMYIMTRESQLSAVVSEQVSPGHRSTGEPQ